MSSPRSHVVSDSSLRRRWPLAWIWLATAVLMALLGVLAMMQLRWLEQVSDADESRTRRALDASLEAVARDFNRQLLRIFADLQPARGRWLLDEQLASDDTLGLVAALLERHRERAEFPDLVAQLHAVVLDDNAMQLFSMLEAVDGASSPRLEAWPARLDPIREHIAAWHQVNPQAIPRRQQRERGRQRPGRQGSSRQQLGRLQLLYGDVPALLIPLHGARPAVDDEDPARRREAAIRGRRRGRAPGLFLIAELDRAVIVDSMMPELVAQHVGSAIDFRLSLVPRSVAANTTAALGAGEAESTEAVLWSLGPPPPQGAVIEAEQPMFGPLVPSDRAFGRWAAPLADFGAEESEWLLRASHPAGSLVAAVERQQRRQALVAFSILGVLGVALLLAIRAVLRSRQLAQQQLSFVAGITHELMTPLAALRSAGQNLADGVVTDGQRVARYGRMIDREGLRLSQLVSQVLAFARMQTGAPALTPRALSAQQAVDDVIDELQPTLEEDSVDLEIRVDAATPEVLADPQALGRVLVNLMSNALKYGRPRDGSPMWLGLRVGPAGRDRVCFEVRDRGPGIADVDLPRIVEPFYRGRGIEASSIAGSGLGLALVKHLVSSMGGTLRVRSDGGSSQSGARSGATFIVELPVAKASESLEEQL